jgi:hypothetical protein
MIDFTDLETLEDLTPSTKTRETFPCLKCSGTGEYSGFRMHQAKTKCFACNGKGHFFTSESDRRKAKAGRTKSKAKKANTFIDNNKTICEWLEANKSWNNFAASLCSQIQMRGTLTENQLTAAKKMMDKTIATKAKRQQERKDATDNAPTISLTEITDLLATAKSNGNSKPRLHVADLVISEAPITGFNAGCLYVKFNGEYAGKITDAGKFMSTSDDKATVESQLLDVAKDPKEAIIKHGRITGQCGCCGRKLTNKASIELGIGPICAENWGL